MEEEPGLALFPELPAGSFQQVGCREGGALESWTWLRRRGCEAVGTRAGVQRVSEWGRTRGSRMRSDREGGPGPEHGEGQQGPQTLVISLLEQRICAAQQEKQE